MYQIDFYNPDVAINKPFIYAVIVSRYQGQWLLCRHKARDTWEVPGGHCEPGETPLESARRELYEESGALEYHLRPVRVYSVSKNGGEKSYGLLCFAEISRLGPLPEGSEIAETAFFDELPANLTYPEIQPVLVAEVSRQLL